MATVKTATSPLDLSLEGEGKTTRARTKIVATVGPACCSEEKITAMVEAGVDVFRVNMAHGKREEHEQVIRYIREVSEQVGRITAVLIDLAGPKIRLGELAEDPMQFEAGESKTFIRGETTNDPNLLVSNYEQLIDELSVGDRVMLADGTVSMRVTAHDGDTATCKIIQGGPIRNRQGINLPGVKLSVPALTDEDIDNAKWASKLDIDFVSLSFVRTDKEIHDLKALLKEHGCHAHVVAKIEKGEALENLKDIVAATDAVMVARGDLGVEIDIAETAVAQKRIVKVCTEFCKPVIIATQMLDSMQTNRRPTRAEVNDVANAILDGADACMLSGETAVGAYPIETVKMMNRIMLATERLLVDAPAKPPTVAAIAGVQAVTAAVVYGAGRIASHLFAKLTVVATRSGATGRVIAKQHSFIPTIGVSENISTLRRLCLCWGIRPLIGAPAAGPPLREFIDRWGADTDFLQKGDRVVYVTGSSLVEGAHNLIVVHEVE